MGAQAPTLQYAVPVSEKQKGQSAVYRSPDFKQKLLETPDENIKNLRDAFIWSFKKYAKNKCLGWIVRQEKNGTKKQSIQSYTYEQTLNRTLNLGSGIVGKGLFHQPEGEKLKFIGIFSKNRPQWTITDLACIMFGITTVPIYDTLGDENISYVFNHTNLTTVFVNDGGVVALKATHDLGNVKKIVCYDAFSKQDKEYFGQKNIQLIKFSEIVEYGQNNKVDYHQKQFDIQPLDCITFSYTSGTTGPPKGAMLSHRNFISLFAALKYNKSLCMNEKDVSICYLPLPHVLQRDVVYTMLYNGGFVVYFSGDINKLKDDIALVKPTIFISVPRLFSRFYDAINKKFDDVTGYAKSALDHGVNIKIKNTKTNGGYTHKVYDPAFFNKTKAALGGRVRYMISGSAPLIPDVHAFMKITMCCPLHEAYGQTQSTGGSFTTDPNDPQVGHVGGPVANNQYKLVDLPEMNYTSDDKDENGQSMPRGEIWMRGPGVFLGYYKNIEKTQQALTKDGWLRSGDVGAILPHNKALKLIDRKKNIFKLQQGEYVASEKVEQIYMKYGHLAEMFLHGQPLHTFAVLIAVPHQQYVQKLAKENQIEGTYEQLCKNIKIRSKILEQLSTIGKQNGLKSFQLAKNIFLQTKPFLQKGILTNTMKLQRHQAKVVFATQIQQMYSEGMIPCEKQKK